MSLRVHFSPFLAGLGLLLTPWVSARADLVTEWNAQALEVMKTSTQAPIMARDLAILNAAIYNAAESIRGGYNTYGVGLDYAVPTGVPAGASAEAAMANAARLVMIGLYGANPDFGTLYNTQLNNIASGDARDAGEQWGQAIAEGILAWRANDNASVAASTAFGPVGTVGYWQPSAGGSALLPGWGDVSTFAIGSTVGYTTTLPSASLASYIATEQYAADFNQVKELGALFSGTRTADQTNIAYFWSSPDGTIKVPGMWNEIATAAAVAANLSVFDTARLFAAMNVAMADAGIVAFADAYDVQFWRPDSAIPNGDNDGNPNTDVDVGWQSLIDSPSYPEYVATQAAISAAAAAVLAEYLGNNVAFSLGSDIDGDGDIDMTRNYTSFSQAADEAAASGIYGGTQFGTSTTDGQTLGNDVGNYVVANNFALVPEPSGLLLILVGSAMGLLKRRKRCI